jgi:hypothetical protein
MGCRWSGYAKAQVDKQMQTNVEPSCLLGWAKPEHQSHAHIR